MHLLRTRAVILAVALLTLLVVGGLSALALAAAGYLEDAHPDEGDPAHGEGVKSPQEIAREKRRRRLISPK